jgi:hypothetical protein
MRPILLMLACAACGGAADPLATLCSAVKPGEWKNWDLDKDGKPSRLEALVGMIFKPAWFAQRFPTVFGELDRDGDGVLDLREINAAADSASSATWSIAAAERRRTVKSKLLPAMAAPGTALQVGSGRTQAMVAFMQQQAYIMDYDVVGGQYDPVVGVISSGMVLEVADVIVTIERKPIGRQNP